MPLCFFLPHFPSLKSRTMCPFFINCAYPEGSLVVHRLGSTIFLLLSLQNVHGWQCSGKGHAAKGAEERRGSRYCETICSGICLLVFGVKDFDCMISSQNKNDCITESKSTCLAHIEIFQGSENTSASLRFHHM